MEGPEGEGFVGEGWEDQIASEDGGEFIEQNAAVNGFGPGLRVPPSVFNLSTMSINRGLRSVLDTGVGL